MTRAARYTVLIDRELGESDGSGVYHDGTGQAAVEQLARELQELWDEAGGTGFFEIIQRQIVTWPATNENLFKHAPRHYEDEGEGEERSAMDYAGRVRFLGAMLGDLMTELSISESADVREAGGLIDDALNLVDSAIRSLEGDGYAPDDSDPNLTYAADGDLVWVDDLHGKPASAPMIRQHLNEIHSVTTADLADYDLVEVHEHEHRVAGPIE